MSEQSGTEPGGPRQIRTVRGVRTRGEGLLLAGTLLLIGLLAGGASFFSDGTAGLALLAWLLAGPILALIQGGQMLRSGAFVGADCCAAWHCSVEQGRAWLGLAGRDPSRLVVYQNPALNAAALWWPGRPLVLITSGLAERLSRPEDDALRRAIWAHELAHARWHQPWTLWLRPPARGPWLLRLVTLPLGLAWSRQAEQSADRLALVASRSLAATVAALLTVSTGVRPADTGALRAQLQQQAGTQAWGLDRLAQLGSSHPLLWTRLQRLIHYALSAEFAAVVGPAVAAGVQAEAAALGYVPAPDGRQTQP